MYHEQHLIIARRSAIDEVKAARLGNLGIAHAALGDSRKAIEYYEQHLIIAREIGDRRGEGTALGNLGLAHAALGDLRKAIEYYEQHLIIAREIGDRRGEGNALWNSALAFDALGDRPSAVARASEALTCIESIGSPHCADVRDRLAAWRAVGAPEWVAGALEVTAPDPGPLLPVPPRPMVRPASLRRRPLGSPPPGPLRVPLSPPPDGPRDWVGLQWRSGTGDRRSSPRAAAEHVPPSAASHRVLAPATPLHPRGLPNAAIRVLPPRDERRRALCVEPRPARWRAAGGAASHAPLGLLWGSSRWRSERPPRPQPQPPSAIEALPPAAAPCALPPGPLYHERSGPGGLCCSLAPGGRGGAAELQGADAWGSPYSAMRSSSAAAPPAPHSSSSWGGNHPTPPPQGGRPDASRSCPLRCRALSIPRPAPPQPSPPARAGPGHAPFGIVREARALGRGRSRALQPHRQSPPPRRSEAEGALLRPPLRRRPAIHRPHPRAHPPVCPRSGAQAVPEEEACVDAAAVTQQGWPWPIHPHLRPPPPGDTPPPASMGSRGLEATPSSRPWAAGASEATPSSSRHGRAGGASEATAS